ncbi:hypothetical protein U5801_28095 [Lamprobacter modestohalophilus]|uniref:TolB family protein n=1 Tax=Lamprobacter modestohalophilus TaxID=1064514 RepID=UPI002ADEF196|nr:hypothetical protein [Lamprobacter modestohalophilus]MEA1053638.1 hypothetical protein [Lamprobacter modestohalophilus]
MQRRLQGIGIHPEAITSALHDAEAHWLILETPQALQAHDDNQLSDLYRVDLLSEQLSLISATPAGAAGNGASRYPASDSQGQLIVFHSDASDLVLDDSNQVSDIFLHDLALKQTTRLSQGEQASANPALDASGQTLLYDQAVSDHARQVLGQSLASASAPEVLSLPSNDTGLPLDSHHPAISADGRYVAYLEAVETEPASSCQVHLFDRDTAVYHRQPCPDALAGAPEQARPMFSPNGDELLWTVPGQAEPLRLPNVLSGASSSH